MVKVSGVPYDVNLPVQQGNLLDLPPLDDMVATLEQENKQMRARMERLEQENHKLEGEVQSLRWHLQKLLSNVSIRGEH